MGASGDNSHGNFDGHFYEEVTGHLVIFTGGVDTLHGSAIAVNHKLISDVTDIRIHNPFMCSCVVSCGKSVVHFTAAYFRQRGVGDEAFQEQISQLDRILGNTGKNVIRIVGLDGNCAIGSAYNDSELKYIGDQGGDFRDARGGRMLDLCRKRSMFVANSLQDCDNDAKYTRFDHHGGQIDDYILISKVSAVARCCTYPLPFTKSDHVPILCLVEISSSVKGCTQTYRKPKGWSPIDVGKYMTEVQVQTADTVDLSDFAHIIEQVARNHIQPRKTRKQRKHEDQLVINTLKTLWRRCTTNQEKHTWSKFITAELVDLAKRAKLKKCQQILENPSKGGWGRGNYTKPWRLQLLDANNEELKDKTLVESTIRDYFMNKFTEETTWTLPNWCRQPHELEPQNVIDFDTVITHISALAKGKSCPNSNHVVGEMLQPLVQGGVEYHNTVGNIGIPFQIARDGVVPEHDLKITFDGACDLEQGTAGVGFCVWDPAGVLLESEKILLHNGTNNVAEYHACLFALQFVSEKYGNQMTLFVQGDSDLVVQQVSGYWSCANEKLRKFRSEIWELTRRFPKVYIQHVYRRFNEEADDMSKQALKCDGNHWLQTSDTGHSCGSCRKGVEIRENSCLETTLFFEENYFAWSKNVATPGMHPLVSLRRCLQNDLLGTHLDQENRYVDIEVQLLPKKTVVNSPKSLRPISLLPCFRKLLGGIVLDMSSKYLKSPIWQFAYTPGVQTLDAVFVLNLIGQRKHEFDEPFILGVSDLPTAFDVIKHETIFNCLCDCGMPKTFVAWYMRELTSSKLHIKTRGFECEPIVQTRGIPQGSKWSPQLYKTVLAYILQPIWDKCQTQKLGIELLDIYVPFMFFSDNMFILAPNAIDFEKILDWIRVALDGSGWHIPNDRVEFQPNKFVDETQMHILDKYARKQLPDNFKCLGCLLNVKGTTGADVQFKGILMESALSMRSDLWQTKNVSRKNKLNLMFKVASGALCWSVGAWTINQRLLSGMKRRFDTVAKRYQRLPRLTDENDEDYAKRSNRLLAATKQKLKQANMDRAILARQYDYIGHVIRQTVRNPGCLLQHALDYKDKQWRLQHEQVLQFQGHQHRVPPWTWEYQFDSYFDKLKLFWRECAADRDTWQQHKKGWVEYRLGRRNHLL